MFRSAAAFAACLAISFAAPSAPRTEAQEQPKPAELAESDVAAFAHSALTAAPGPRRTALAALAARGKPDVAASLILALRYRGPDPAILEALTKLTGSPIKGWPDAMLWQEAHPEVKPHPSYRDLKLEVYESIDPQFLRFLGGERSEAQNMRIRLEEIAWGGVRVDGIPSLDNPALIPAAEAKYLGDGDLVFGVAINGDARAYPLRIMGWHEMFNETIGGVPVALAYCTLCGAGILFETKVEGREKPFVFGSSGFLYRSNKLMFDRETDSLWNQFTGEPVTGPLAKSGIRLKMRPVVITSWAKWRAAQPGTRVLSLETGHRRDYREGVVYRDYFASPDLMFPTRVGDESVAKRKDFVFGMRDVGVAKAWPLEAFRKRPVINDQLGDQPVVLVGDAATRSVRAYARGAEAFAPGDAPDRLVASGETWTIGEDAIAGPGGRSHPRLPGHVSYWFAWDGYHGVASELYRE